MSVKADFLALSKVGPDLFVTGRNELEIFAINLDHLRTMEEPVTTETEDQSLNMNVTFLGKKLGLATGIESDFSAGLIYYMVRDYAIVRWKTRYPLLAEYHDVLAQSYDSFPYISGFYTDPENNIWAIVNPVDPNECNNILQNSKPFVEVPSRLVWIIKYDKYSEKNEVEKSVEEDE